MGTQQPSASWRAELKLFEFATDVTDLGWGAACDLNGHAVTIEPGRTGWRVISTRVRDGFVHAESFHTTPDSAAEAAVQMVLDIDLVLALVPHLDEWRAA